LLIHSQLDFILYLKNCLIFLANLNLLRLTWRMFSNSKCFLVQIVFTSWLKVNYISLSYLSLQKICTKWLFFLSVFCKDAGFVYESFRNETNRIFWDFWSYKSNPQNGYLKIASQNESTKRIFWKLTGFANPEVQDSYGFVSL
jgi:hypothetical protein